MTVDELKAKVEAHREHLKRTAGQIIKTSADGPIGIGIIDAIVATMEALEQRVQEIERRTIA